MRARTRLSAGEWAERLDACMRMVLADPDRFDPCVQWWAERRREWLASQPAAPTQPARPRGAEQYSLLAPLEERK